MRAAKTKIDLRYRRLSGPSSLRRFSTLPRSFSSATSAAKRGIRCTANRPPLDPYKLAGCAGSPSSYRQVAPRAFCSSHVSFVPGNGLERPVGRLDGEGSVRAPNSSSIPKVASGAQSGTPRHSGLLLECLSLLQSSGSRQGAPATLERHGRRPRRPWRAIWRRGGNCRGRGARTPKAWILPPVPGGIDRLAHAVMDARLWLVELMQGRLGCDPSQ
jgi:hypothetical protein